uniref:F-box domain-containing protein n=1 Tax=Hymenolepis diminuta TaxID=6216 RepID=A0A0R3SJJ0_HYMDI
LPDVILRKIFSYLDPMDFANCAMVNQGWKIAVDFNASASELNLSKIANRATDKSLICLLKRRKATLRKINLANCSLLTETGLQALLPCHNLQVINFAHCRNLTDEIVGDLIQASPSLLKLDLSNTFVSDVSILQLVMYSCKLSQLSIAYCSNITDIGLSFFKGSRLASIVDYIDLSGCSNVTSCGLIDFVKSMRGAHTWILSDLPQLSNEALRIITSKANLKSLEVRRGKTPKKYSTIEKQIEKFKNEKSEIAKDLSFIDVKSDNLESLSIYGDHTTQWIELNSDKLTKLVIVNCPYNITTRGIEALLDNSRGIRKLELSKPKPSTLELIQNRCPYLHTLKLSKCSKISETDLYELREKCPQLRHLEIRTGVLVSK